MERATDRLQLDADGESVDEPGTGEGSVAAPAAEAGGEAACFAHLVCPDCGVVLDGSAHRAGCSSAA
jgi:hypothetical protein